MAKLKIKNFGPIQKGFSENDGFLEISPVTVICGNQATGKSTIAKLYSTCAWLEKANVKSELGMTSENIDDLVSLCKPHRIDEYFNEQTEIHYIGTTCEFIYQNRKFSSKTIDLNKNLIQYKRPKIMYVPAERNLLTSIEDAENIKNLPSMLSILMDEYEKAKKASKSGEFDLPISNVKLIYDKNSLTMKVVTDNNRTISIYSASSGIQSVTPLSIVSKYITEEVSSNFLKNIQKLSANERKQIKEWIKKDTKDEEKNQLLLSSFDQLIYGKTLNESIAKDIEKLLHYFFNTCFINIVEEPEQNLYPQSQNKVLYELLECKNNSDENKLLITTHSPYILAYLTQSAKAAELLAKGVPEKEIEKIIPVKAAVPGEMIHIYETKSDGSIKLLEPYENLPSDDNELNKALEEQNDSFSDLLELEAKFCK